MDINYLAPTDPGFPITLLDIPQPPSGLYVIGTRLSELMGRLRIAVVGSRLVTSYGRSVTLNMTRELAGQGAVIISGLAVGVDALAHQAALEVNGSTIAVLAGGLDAIYPQRNEGLAKQIIAQGGVLISEYPPGTPCYKHNFVERNRLISGLSEGVLIPEAGHKSGSLHTAQFALEQGKTVMAVPGNISSPLSEGTNTLIRTGTAALVTSARDIFHALNLEITGQRQSQLDADTPEEAAILKLLEQGIKDGAKLLTKSNLEAPVFNQSLTMLEITGRIRALGANQWILYQ